MSDKLLVTRFIESGGDIDINFALLVQNTIQVGLCKQCLNFKVD